MKNFRDQKIDSGFKFTTQVITFKDIQQLTTLKTPMLNGIYQLQDK
jgi:hypothetical protein